MTVYDAFGVARPDLIVKARKPGIDSDEAKRQRLHAALYGPIVASQYAPKGKRGEAYGRAVGAGSAGAVGGGVAGGLAGYGLSAATRGRIRPLLPTGVGILTGSSVGQGAGLHRSTRTTQRK